MCLNSRFVMSLEDAATVIPAEAGIQEIRSVRKGRAKLESELR